MGLALSSNSAAASSLLPRANGVSQEVFPYPVWVSASRKILQNPGSLPLPVRIFVISLQSADRVVLSLGRDEQGGGSAFILRMDARCPTAAAANTAKTQLDLDTKALRVELARERQEPSPSDLTGLLVNGRFEVVNTRVVGSWPVRKELLKTLE
jgi:hypothetical protein